MSCVMCDAVTMAELVAMTGGPPGRAAEANAFATLRRVERAGLKECMDALCEEHRALWKRAVEKRGALEEMMKSEQS